MLVSIMAGTSGAMWCYSHCSFHIGRLCLSLRSRLRCTFVLRALRMLVLLILRVDLEGTSSTCPDPSFQGKER